MANNAPTGVVRSVSITEEMKDSYIDYAMSVIVARALPDVRDGLKPVHRRILYAMRDMGMRPNRPHRKSARVVGEVLGKYHPHGELALYDAMARMAQDFSYRYPLVDGHGNFGSIDGDSPAAMRYTEVRMAKIAEELMQDIDKDTVDFVDNFDGELEEPTVLPARFPHLLVNGASGIAVGMATNIPPHNLSEVINGVLAMIEEPEITSEALMEHIPGPDFPTGGLIVGREAIRKAYTTGRGIITMRARTEIEERRSGSRIVVSEIPYQVNKAKLIEKIADLVRGDQIDGITNLGDESDRTGLRIVIDVHRNANPNVVLNKLFKYTPLQQSFGIINLALVDNQPEVMTLRETLRHYLDHQKDVVTRRTEYDLAKAEARAHILEGLRIALDHIDAIIDLIRSSDTVDAAREGLIDHFDLSEKQAKAILEMRLQRLTGLERDKIEDEYSGLLADIEHYRAVLADEEMLLSIIRDELTEIRDRFGDERRTEITIDMDADINIEDLVAEEDVVITLTHQGYLKRMPISRYRAQHRGGRGITGAQTKDEDFVEQLFVTTTHHSLLFFTNKGQVYQRRAFQIPEASRQARGTAAINVAPVDRDEKINAVIPIKDFAEDQYLVAATRGGIIKKTPLEEYDTNRRGGIIAINLDDDDELIGVRLTEGGQEIMLVTAEGMAIRFPEEDARPMGRVTRGVIGIRLAGDDEVVSMETVRPGDDLLVVTDQGYGKRTPLAEYRPQGRGGKGLKTLNRTPRVGLIVSARMVDESQEIMAISADGILIRIPVSDISVMGRNTQGVLVMRVQEGDRVVAVARVKEEADEDADGDGAETDEAEGGDSISEDDRAPDGADG